MYYPSSENKGADQLRGYREADLRLCFRLCRLLVFPWGGSFIGSGYEHDKTMKYDHITGNINEYGKNFYCFSIFIEKHCHMQMITENT